MPDEDGPSGLGEVSGLNVRHLLDEAVRMAPDSTFLIYGEQRTSYADFNREVYTAAAAWSSLGVKKGDRVAFMLENRPEFLQAWFGLAEIGAILVAINTRWQAREVSHFLELTEPRFALIGTPHREVFREAMTRIDSLECVLSLGEDSEFRDFHAVLRDVTGSAPRHDLHADDEISFISTSGTTGRPKAVMQTHGNYVLTGEGYSYWMELKPGERIYLCLPLFHINSQAYTVMGAIAARATIVLVERFSASRFWSDMAEYGVNVFNYIGSMMAVLLKRDVMPEERQHAVRLTYGGPALPGPLRADVEERFGLTVISGIGMSETTYGLIESIHGERRSASLGKPRQHPYRAFTNEARVVDDVGTDVPSGVTGELIFRSPVLMKGYFRDPEQTTTAIRDGWLYTGDLVRRDEEGFFYFVDRKKDVIRVRGENVSSIEVEQVLMEHPEVQEAAVVGVPSELTDEEIAAFVLLRPGRKPNADELIAWCRSRAAIFKVPRYVWTVDSLPKTETQRVEKHRLRELARERLADQSERVP